MKSLAFDRNKHVYRNDAFAELVKDAIRFFNGTALDGFGNHDPGKGRYEQAKSDWDIIHPGRVWAERCKGICKEEKVILNKVESHLKGIG